eukprot:scaffold2857_cov344-Pavlova_lutheri.AAC.20
MGHTSHVWCDTSRGELRWPRVGVDLPSSSLPLWEKEDFPNRMEGSLGTDPGHRKEAFPVKGGERRVASTPQLYYRFPWAHAPSVSPPPRKKTCKNERDLVI